MLLRVQSHRYGGQTLHASASPRGSIDEESLEASFSLQPERRRGFQRKLNRVTFGNERVINSRELVRSSVRVSPVIRGRSRGFFGKRRVTRTAVIKRGRVRWKAGAVRADVTTRSGEIINGAVPRTIPISVHEGYIKLCRIFNMCYNIGTRCQRNEDEAQFPSSIRWPLPAYPAIVLYRSIVMPGGRGERTVLNGLRQWPMMKLSSDNGSITLHRLQWGPVYVAGIP